MVKSVAFLWPIFREEAVAQRVIAHDVLGQQAIGAMDCDAARECMMDGEVPDVCGWVITSPFIYITGQVEVNRVLTHQLLSHMLQLHALQVCCLKSQSKLDVAPKGIEVKEIADVVSVG